MSENKPAKTTQASVKKVDADELLNNIEKFISEHAILPEGASEAIALWCLSSFNINQFRIFPKLTITSPEKRCGKSTVLDLVEAFSSNALMTSNMSPASIYRLIEDSQPTLIIDETDTFLKGKTDDMVGIINSGHAKSRAFVMRCVGDTHQVKRFSTWAPMVLASIGGLQSTIMDRSIAIPLRRKTKNETVKRIPSNLFDSAIIARDDLLKWSIANEKAIKANPVVPSDLGNDRAVDNWIPLFTLAAQVSPEWLNKCEVAYRLLTDIDEEPETSTLLLADIQEILNTHTESKIPSADLVCKLITDKDKQWCEYKNGRPMSQYDLAAMLKPYKIKPKVIRHNGSTPRGYELDQFRDAFDRYLP